MGEGIPRLLCLVSRKYMTTALVYETGRPETSSGRYSQSVDPLLSYLQSALANIDDQYWRDREDVINDPRHGGLKAHILRKLEQRHQERRLPYVQELAVLENRKRRVAA
jgi:hypothetical protein